MKITNEVCTGTFGGNEPDECCAEIVGVECQRSMFHCGPCHRPPEKTRKMEGKISGATWQRAKRDPRPPVDCGRAVDLIGPDDDHAIASRCQRARLPLDARI